MKLFKKKNKNTLTPPVPVIGTAGSLREFVYLDEVSVYSLTSAPDKPPPVTMSESADSTAGESVSGQIEGGAPLVGKANISGALNSSQSTGMQVQRQFNIQSQFARLHGMYRPTFLMTANAHDMKGKEASSLNDALIQLEKAQHAIRATALTRGALAELRVSLRAHHTFDISVFMKVISGLVKKYPELLQIRDAAGIQNVMEAGEFLAELMEDLVPIEGHSTTHEIVTDTDGTVWIADIAALNSVWNTQVLAQPLRVVGVAESASFWKDTRRILHAEAEFDVLGRISRTGLQPEWTPVKMIDTFKRVAPSVAKGLIDAVDGLKAFTDDIPATVEPAADLLAAGTTLNLDLANHHGLEAKELSPQTLADLQDDGTLEGKLSALSAVVDEFYSHDGNLVRDEDQVGILRQEAWRKAQVMGNLPKREKAFTGPESTAPVLELEFIAMYW